MYFTTFVIAALASSPLAFAAQEHYSEGDNGYSHEGGFAHPTGSPTHITTHRPHGTGHPEPPCPSHSRNGTHHHPEEKSHFQHPSQGFPHPSGSFSHSGRPHHTAHTHSIPTSSIAISETIPEPTETADVYDRRARRRNPLEERRIPVTEDSVLPYLPKPTTTCTETGRPEHPKPSMGFPHPSGGHAHSSGRHPHPSGGFPHPTGGPGHHGPPGGYSGFETFTKTSARSGRPTMPVYDVVEEQ